MEVMSVAGGGHWQPSTVAPRPQFSTACHDASGPLADVMALAPAILAGKVRCRTVWRYDDDRTKDGTGMTIIYVDADACPVKQEVARVAERHGLVAHFVSNTYIRLPESPLVTRVVVGDEPDAADD